MATVGEKPFTVEDGEATPVVEEPNRKRMALVASKGGLDEVYPILIMATTAAALDRLPNFSSRTVHSF